MAQVLIVIPLALDAALLFVEWMSGAAIGIFEAMEAGAISGLFANADAFLVLSLAIDHLFEVGGTGFEAALEALNFGKAWLAQAAWEGAQEVAAAQAGALEGLSHFPSFGASTSSLAATLGSTAPNLATFETSFLGNVATVGASASSIGAVALGIGNAILTGIGLKEATTNDSQSAPGANMRDAFQDAHAMDCAQNAGFVGSEALATAGQGGPFIITTGGSPGSKAARVDLTSYSKPEFGFKAKPAVDQVEAYVTGLFGSTYAPDGATQLAFDAPYTCGIYCGLGVDPFNILFSPGRPGQPKLAHFEHVDPPKPKNGTSWTSTANMMSDPFASILALPMGVGMYIWDRTKGHKAIKRQLKKLKSEAKKIVKAKKKAKGHHRRRDVQGQHELQHSYEPLTITYDSPSSRPWYESNTDASSKGGELEPRGIMKKLAKKLGFKTMPETHFDLEFATLIRYNESTITPADLPYLHNLHIAVVQPGRLLVGDVLGQSPWTSHGFISGVENLPNKDGWKTGILGFYLPNHNNLIMGWWLSTIGLPDANVHQSFSNMYLNATANQPVLHSTGLLPTMMNNVSAPLHGHVVY